MLLFLMACHSATAPIDTGETLEPSPYLVDEADPVTANLSSEEVGSAVQELLSQIKELNAAPVFEAYEAAMLGAEPGCPDFYEDEGNVYWYDYCYASDGSYFTGYAFSQDYNGQEVDGYSYTGQTVYSVAEVTNANGNVFTGGGSVQLLRADSIEGEKDVTHTIWMSVLEGGYAYDGPETAGTWMSEGITPSLTLQFVEIPEEADIGISGRIFTATGGVSGLQGIAGTVVLDNFQVWPAAFGNSCPEEPHGIVSVRDDEGLWYDVVFDGSPAWTEEAVAPALCDGCGGIYFRGEKIGSTCVDVLDLPGELGAEPW